MNYKYFLPLIGIIFLTGCESVKNINTQKKVTVKTTPKPLPKLTKAQLKALKLFGARQLKDGNIGLDDIIIHRREHEVSFPAKFNVLQGTIEVIVSTKNGRGHESLFYSDTNPLRLQLALILAGYKNGAVFSGGPIPQGSKMGIDVLLNGKRYPAEYWLYNKTKQRNKEDLGYIFVGSSFTSSGECLAVTQGNLIDINSRDFNTILLYPITNEHINDEFIANEDRTPTPITVKDKNGKEQKSYQIPVRIILYLKKNKHSKKKES
jgi:hypothetical protein